MHFISANVIEDPHSIVNIISDVWQTYEEVINEEDGAHDELSKRSIESDDDYDKFIMSRNSSDSNVCRSEIWKCMSGVMEGGIKYIKEPEDIYSSLTPVLYKAVFHGGVKSMWSSVMEVNIIISGIFTP